MATAYDEETIEGDVIGNLQTAQRLPPDLMLLKMENESMMAAAAMRPRNPMAIVAQLKQLIDAYPAAADEAIYAKPVGKVSLVECGKCAIKYEVPKVDGDTCCPACESKEKGRVRQVKKFAEGLSIRAAESIRSVFGYTRLATTCEMLENGDAQITGVLVDYCAGNMTSDQRVVSRRYKAYNGSITETPIDRFINVVVKAEKAKLRRDVILDSTPAIIKALFRDECEKKLIALVSPEQIEQKIIPAFSEFGLTRDHVEAIIGRPAKMGWKEEERLLLRKVLAALKSGETTAGELIDDLAGRNGAKAAETKVKPSKLNDTDDSTDQRTDESNDGVDEPSKDDGTQAMKMSAEEQAEMELLRQAQGDKPKRGKQSTLMDTAPQHD